MTDWQDHYFVLGLDRNASQDEIKEAYRFKAFTLHPDRLIGAPESKKHRAEEELKKLNAAYEILKDPQKRNQYNLELDKRTQSNAKTKPNQQPVLTKFECDHDHLSPQVSGSTIVWTAHVSDPGGEAVYYRFLLKGGSTKWEWKLVRDWHPGNTWIWKTTFEGDNKDHGIFHVKVEIRNKFHVGPDEYDDQSVSEYILFTPIEKKFYDSALKRGLELIPQLEVVTSYWNYRLDFAKFIKNREGPEIKVDIELDGLEGHKTKEQLINDAKRDNNLKLDGWEVIRFRGSQIYNNSEGCIDQTIQLIELWSSRVNRSRIGQPPIIKNLNFNLKSPQPPGSNIVCIAQLGTPMANAIFYRFWLKGPLTGDVWHDTTGWTKYNRWNWKTSSSDIGNSQVKVEIRDETHINEYGFDAQLVESYTIVKPNHSPVLHSLKPDTSSPQSFRSAIVWTAQATDPNFDQIYYKFWQKGPATRNVWLSMTDWTRDNRWTWRPTSADLGINSVKVEIRDGYHEGPDKCDDWDTAEYRINRKILSLDSLDLQKAMAALIILIIFWMAWGFVTSNKLPEINSLTSDKYSPEFVHSTIIWTASALDSEKDNMLYRFWLKGPATGNTWNTMTSWTSNNSWTWGTSSEDVGENQIKVQVRDGKHAGADGFDAEKTAGFTITKPSLVISSLMPSRYSPQAAGSEITWTADAYDPAGGRVYYRYSIIGPTTEGHRTLMTDWTTDNKWTWETKPAGAGNYQIYVEIRDENHVTSEEIDAYKVESFTLTNTPPELTRLNPDKTSSQAFGTAITWKAISSDPNDDAIYYRFWLSGPSTGIIWKIMQDWNISNTWSWVTAPSDTGDNEVKVQVRDGNHAGINGFDAEKTASFTVTKPLPVNGSPIPSPEGSNPETTSSFTIPKPLLVISSLMPSPSSTGTPGEWIKWTASTNSIGEEGIYYRFLLSGPSTSKTWKVKQDWSTINTWIWGTSSSDIGNNEIKVQVRKDIQGNWEKFDAEETVDYLIQSRQPIHIGDGGHNRTIVIP